MYECVEKKSGRRLAVKIWKGCSEDIVRDIKHSFLLLRQLSHPYLLKAEELFVEADLSKCYMVSEVCQYRDLRVFLEAKAAKQEKVA